MGRDVATKEIVVTTMHRTVYHDLSLCLPVDHSMFPMPHTFMPIYNTFNFIELSIYNRLDIFFNPFTIS